MIPSPPSGLLLVDKPQGWTSHDVVAFLRKFFPRKTKVGHAGTLDPLATGLLVLLIGKATKSAALLQGLPKTYSGTIRFGLETETGDMEGKILTQMAVPETDRETLRRLFAGYQGEVALPIPRFSAVKHKGRPLYAYARKGIATPEKSRTTTIESLELLNWETPEARFRVRCSSGTYVRALAEDVGKKLGCPATLSALRREGVGPYLLLDARPLEELRETARTRAGALAALLSPLEANIAAHTKADLGV